MDYSSVEKFIDTMGIKYRVKVSRQYLDSRGKQNICVKIVAFYNDKLQYLQHHCYEFTNQGLMSYAEGNNEFGVNQGVFAYLGDEYMVDKYFDMIGRDVAREEYQKLKRYEEY